MVADGLYAVVSDKWVAGFIVKDGRVVDAAPLIARQVRANLYFWARRARYLGP